MTETQSITPRSAHPTIRGYWWQFVVSCKRWLELDSNQFMVCEGVEDIDIIQPLEGERYKARFEQLKDYQSKKISIGNEDGRAILANFASCYVREINAHNEPQFKLITTAERANQKGDIDVLALWLNRKKGKEPEETLLSGIRDALSKAIDELSKKTKTSERAEHAQEALNWFEEEEGSERWSAFLDAVEWHFEHNDLVASHAELLDIVKQRVGDELAQSTVDRLLIELITQVALGSENNPRFDRQQLNIILEETQAERDAWIEEHNPTLMLVNTLMELSLTDSQATKEALEKLSNQVAQNNALLNQLVKQGLLEGQPFGLESATPIWDELKLQTRATINSKPRVRINQHSPLPRQTLQQLEEGLIGDNEDQLFILEGVGGIGKSTALVTCAKHLLDDSAHVVLLLDVDQIQPGTPLESIVPNPSNQRPDRLLVKALQETGRARGVLIIDQLDRLSQISAASEAKHDYFEQIKKLITLTLEHDQLSVLVACRSFDHEVDTRMGFLVEHPHSKTLKLKPLNAQDVQRVVHELGYTPRLTDAQIKILSIPLHLHLLAGLEKRDHTQQVPIDEYQLYKRFWDDKQRLLRRRLDSKWGKLHQTICNLFLNNKRRFVTEREIEDHLADIEILVSEDILRRTRDGFVYFHQRYEEYVFARYFKGDLIEYIQEENESFSALDQVMAILKDKRQQSVTEEDCVDNLRTLIFGNFHVSYQRLVRTMLAVQAPLLNSEFDLWLEMLSSEDSFIKTEARSIFWQNTAFVSELRKRELLEELFVDGAICGQALEETELASVRKMAFEHLFSHFPEDGAMWFNRLINDEENFPWLRNSLNDKHCYTHRVVFDAFINSINKGLWIIDQKDSYLIDVYDLPKKNSSWVAEMIAACVLHNIDCLDVKTQIKEGDFNIKYNCLRATFKTLAHVETLKKLSKQNPCAVITHFTPLLPDLLKHFMVSETECFLWSHFRPTEYLYTHEAWLVALFESLQACTDAPILHQAAEIATSIPNHSNSARMVRWRLLLGGTIEHVSLAVSELSNVLRTSGSMYLPDRYVTIALLLQSASTRLPTQQWHELLNTLVAYVPDLNDDELNARMRDRLLYPLLSSLALETLTPEATDVLEDLSNRLPESNSRLDEPAKQGGYVDEIDHIDFAVMNDDEIIDYIHNAQPQSTGFLHEPDKFRTLEKAASDDCERFLNILLKRFDEVPSDVKCSIIMGWQNALQDKSAHFSNDIWAQVLAQLVRIYNEIPVESARNISYLLYRYSGVPNETVVEIVIDAMLNHPDPEEENWDNPKNLYSASYDCIRGRMAEMLGRWVGKDQKVFKQAKQAIIDACKDPSTQVRVAVGCPVLMSLNHDRTFALEQLLVLVDDQPDELLATYYVIESIRYMVHDSLDQLNPIIDKMLTSDIEEVKRVGGRAFCFSTFVEAERTQQLVRLIDNESIACGIAFVLKGNIKQLSQEQRSILFKLLDHSSDEVLEELSNFFYKTPKDLFLENAPHILEVYFDSRIARTRNNDLFHAIEQWTLAESHPSIVIEATDHTIELKRELQTLGQNTHVLDERRMCKALEIIYTQHHDYRARVKTILDALIRSGSRNAEQTLDNILKIP